MRAHGQTAVWGTHIGVRRTHDSKRWYQQLREWWAARSAARRQAKLAAMNASWNAERETLKPMRVEAAPEMALAQGTLSLATQMYALIQ
jgi:hypothetical protein